MLARAEAGTLGGEQVGGYAIGQGTLAADSNYTITFTGNTLTISPASLTVSATPDQALRHQRSQLDRQRTGLVDTTVDGVTIDDTARLGADGTWSGLSLAPSPVSRSAITPLGRER